MMSSKSQPKVILGCRLRPMEFQDIPAVEELCRQHMFDVSAPNMKLYLETSPGGYNVIQDPSGQIVGVEGCHIMENGLGFSATILIHNDFVGKGLTQLFPNKHVVRMGNATSDSIQRFKTWPVFRHKLNGFLGQPQLRILEQQVAHLTDLSIERISRSNLADIVKYDQQLIPGIDRSKFWQEWCLAEKYPVEVHSFVAYDSSRKVCGWGAVRRYPMNLTISPLYADTTETAKLICLKLLETIGPRYVFLFAPASNLAMAEVARDTGLRVIETEFCWHSDEEPVRKFFENILWDKVFAIHEFWPI